LMLPELSQNVSKPATPLLKKEYSSDDTVLDYKGTLELLKKNNLLDIQASATEGELLR
jgi:hypothetical protein